MAGLNKYHISPKELCQISRRYKDGTINMSGVEKLIETIWEGHKLERLHWDRDWIKEDG